MSAPRGLQYQHGLEAAPQRTNRQRLFFADTPGGTGKRLMTSTLQGYIKSKGLKVLTLALSATAVQLSDGDRAAHSAFRVPVPVHQQSTCSIDVIFELADELLNA